MTKQRDRGSVAKTRRSETATRRLAQSPWASSHAILSSLLMSDPEPSFFFRPIPMSSSRTVNFSSSFKTVGYSFSSTCFSIVSSRVLCKMFSMFLYFCFDKRYFFLHKLFSTMSHLLIKSNLIIKSCGHEELMLNVSRPNDGHFRLPFQFHSELL